MWQESKSVDEHTAVATSRVPFACNTKKVFDDQAEALTAEPVKRLEHLLRRSINPSLVHVHRHELVQQRTVVAGAAARVIRHHVVRRVHTQAMFGGEATRDGGFTCCAGTADPVNVSKLFLKR